MLEEMLEKEKHEVQVEKELRRKWIGLDQLGREEKDFEVCASYMSVCEVEECQ